MLDSHVQKTSCNEAVQSVKKDFRFIKHNAPYDYQAEKIYFALQEEEMGKLVDSLMEHCLKKNPSFSLEEALGKVRELIYNDANRRFSHYPVDRARAESMYTALTRPELFTNATKLSQKQPKLDYSTVQFLKKSY